MGWGRGVGQPGIYQVSGALSVVNALASAIFSLSQNGSWRNALLNPNGENRKEEVEEQPGLRATRA